MRMYLTLMSSDGVLGPCNPQEMLVSDTDSDFKSHITLLS